MVSRFACRSAYIFYNGRFTLDDTKNDSDAETDNDSYGFHCNTQNTSHCTEILPLMSLATFSYFIGPGLGIVLGVAQCEDTITSDVLRLIVN